RTGLLQQEDRVLAVRREVARRDVERVEAVLLRGEPHLDVQLRARHAAGELRGRRRERDLLLVRRSRVVGARERAVRLARGTDCRRGRCRDREDGGDGEEKVLPYTHDSSPSCEGLMPSKDSATPQIFRGASTRVSARASPSRGARRRRPEGSATPA